MHTASVLHKLLIRAVPSIHAVRLAALMAAVQALTQSAKASVSSLGRGLVGNVYDKHKIKRMDRLVCNQHLYRERHAIYTALTQRMMSDLSEPVIAMTGLPQSSAIGRSNIGF